MKIVTLDRYNLMKGTGKGGTRVPEAPHPVPGSVTVLRERLRGLYWRPFARLDYLIWVCQYLRVGLAFRAPTSLRVHRAKRCAFDLPAGPVFPTLSRSG